MEKRDWSSKPVPMASDFGLYFLYGPF